MLKQWITSSTLVVVLFSLISCSRTDSIISLKQKELSKQAELLNRSLNNISILTSYAAKQTEVLYTSPVNAEKKKKFNPRLYHIQSSGVLYKTRDDGGSSVFVSGFVPVDETIRNTVMLTESLDSLFVNLAHFNPLISQIYFNDENSLCRIYPYRELLTLYQPKVEIPSFNFYYLADERHNPKHHQVWVDDPYLDPSGMGWMVSSIAPVYDKQHLMGVVGIDITIDQLSLALQDYNSGNCFLVSQNGTVVFAEKPILDLFSIPMLEKYKYYTVVNDNTSLVDAYNLKNNKNLAVRNLFNIITSKDKGKTSIEIGSKTYHFLFQVIPSTHWYLVERIGQ